MGRRAFTISLLAFLGFVILQTVSADEPSEELAAQLNSNVGSLLEPSENQFRLVRSPGADAKKPKGRKQSEKPRRRKPNGKTRGRPGRRSKSKGNRTGRKEKENGQKKKRPSRRNGGGKKKKQGPGNGNGGKKTKKQRPRNGNGGKKTKKQRRRNGLGGKKKKNKIPRNGKGEEKKKRQRPKKGTRQGRPDSQIGPFNRQTECNEQELCKRIKLYIKYSNQQRKAKRILRTCKTMKSKHDKAGTEFEATAAAIKNSDDTNVTAIQATLATCKTTAKALCADTNVDQCSAAEQTKINACITKLKTWIDAFGPGATSCLGQEKCCTCINNISPAAPDDCLNYDDIDKESLKKKNKCTKSEAGGGEKGSFGDCRKQQQLAAEQGPPAFGKKCKNGAVTTAKPSGRKRKAVVKIRKELNIKK